MLRCLRSLADQSYPRDHFEIIVVDDGSHPPIDRLAVPFEKDIQFRLICQERKGAASARNSGAEQARGKYLAFTDDDCCPHSSWLHHLAQCCNKFPDAAVTGKTLNLLEENAYASTAQLLIDYLYAYYNASPQCARFLTSNNFALPAASFRTLGGFHAEFPAAGGEDREFCDRWLSKSLSVIYLPEAIVFHAHSMTLAGFVKQQFNYGRGAFHFNRLRSSRSGAPFSIEPPAFYIDMFRYPYLKQKILNAHLSTLLFAVSQGVNLAGFAFESIAYHARAQD